MPRRPRRGSGPPGATTTPEQFHQLHLKGMLEATWHQQVLDLLVWNGFPEGLIYHTRDSRGSPKGFPDLMALRWRGEVFTLVMVEEKREGEQPTPEQAGWLRALAELAGAVNRANCGGRVLTGVWRPSDRERIKELLR